MIQGCFSEKFTQSVVESVFQSVPRFSHIHVISEHKQVLSSKLIKLLINLLIFKPGVYQPTPGFLELLCLRMSVCVCVRPEAINN